MFFCVKVFFTQTNKKCYKNIDRADYVIRSPRIEATAGRPITSSLIQPKSKFLLNPLCAKQSLRKTFYAKRFVC
uniref:ORF93 n=1 Tax=Cnaphalocrocis medinalis granulovirus TaxID=1750712 RepID=A0A0X9H2Z2_9BBAC|nr:ORF93 [Cnaphalocrocis medinalis granulovirus]